MKSALSSRHPELSSPSDIKQSLTENKQQLKGCQTSNVTELKRTLLIVQATCESNCYRCTGLSLSKLNLVFQQMKIHSIYFLYHL